MRHYLPLLLAALAASQYYNNPIYSDNGLSWRGISGDDDFCDNNYNFSLAYGLDFKFSPLNLLDNVGGNGVKLYCRDAEGSITGYVSSLEGKKGEWQGIHSCPTDHHFNGFRLRVFPDQGTWGDDFGVDNIQLVCSNGTVVDGLEGVMPGYHTVQEEEEDKGVIREMFDFMGRKMEAVRQHLGNTRIHGDWGSWAYCSPGLHVAGIQTRVEDGHIDDDAGLTDVILYCV